MPGSRMSTTATSGLVSPATRNPSSPEYATAVPKP